MVCPKADHEANTAAHVAVLEQAALAQCDVAVFPEFSLTGSIDPRRAPDAALTLDNDDRMTPVLTATATTGVAAVFGFSERAPGGDAFYISQAFARDGRIAGIQRKRHLGEDEEPYTTGHGTLVFDVGDCRTGVVICAEAGVDFTWDATAAAGARVVLMCAAPGLCGRRTNEAEWRAGFEWWEEWGVGNARNAARRLGIPVALATQAGATADEDFPGIAALVDARGGVVDRLPDWRPGTLVVEIDP
jgi:predicted amidohydrolase